MLDDSLISKTELCEKIQVLRIALQSVEWVWMHQYWSTCPWCKAENHNPSDEPNKYLIKHEKDCLRQRALSSSDSLFDSNQ